MKMSTFSGKIYQASLVNVRTNLGVFKAPNFSEYCDNTFDTRLGNSLSNFLSGLNIAFIPKHLFWLKFETQTGLFVFQMARLVYKLFGSEVNTGYVVLWLEQAERKMSRL